MAREAAELKAKLARKEADLEEGITTAVRARSEVTAAEGRAMAAEQRYATERKDITRIQLEWAIQKESLKETITEANQRKMGGKRSITVDLSMSLSITKVITREDSLNSSS
jgi:hypothetical protein